MNELTKLQHITAEQDKLQAEPEWYREMLFRVRTAMMAPIDQVSNITTDQRCICSDFIVFSRCSIWNFFLIITLYLTSKNGVLQMTGPQPPPDGQPPQEVAEASSQ